MHVHVSFVSFLVVGLYVVLFLALWKLWALQLDDDNPFKAAMLGLV